MTSLGNNQAASLKTETSATIWPSSGTPGHFSQGNENLHFHKNPCSSFVCKHPNLQTTQMSSGGWLVIQTAVQPHMEWCSAMRKPKSRIHANTCIAPVLEKASPERVYIYCVFACIEHSWNDGITESEIRDGETTKSWWHMVICGRLYYIFTIRPSFSSLVNSLVCVGYISLSHLYWASPCNLFWPIEGGQMGQGNSVN